MTDPRRLIPGVDRLLESASVRELLDSYPRERVVVRLREAIAHVRDQMKRGQGPDDPEAPELYAEVARTALEQDDLPSLRPVINATGVVLHTNLGRAPLAEVARAAMARIGRGYSNLELDLTGGRRGSRYVHCAALLEELTGAEDALVVNNCAAALILAVNTVGAGEGVLVSRGELVEIGGGFRIPEILERAGGRLVEVGSTNRTRLADYREAVDAGGAAAILKVHRSNFRISGFTEEVSLPELAGLARKAGLAMIHDVGSGLLVDPAVLGLPEEPRPSRSVEHGADVAVFSGDKLLGGPQAGLVVGTSDVVGRMRSNPLCRALRVDKATLAALEATLRLYRDPDRALAEIPTLRMLRVAPEVLQSRASTLVDRIPESTASVEAAPGRSAVGGGTFPGVELPTWTLRVTPAGTTVDELAARLRAGEPPVVARREEGALVLDLRTVQPDEEDALVERLAGALVEGEG